MTRRSLLVLVTTLGLLTAACGSRVVPLSQGQPGLGGEAGVQQPGTDAGAPIAQPTGPAQGEVPGGAPVQPGTGAGTATRTPGQSGNTGGGGTTSGARACSGGATDVGVTATTIKVGAVIQITGPLPGQFNAARDAVDSHFKMINEQGGICGRKFQFIVRDDGGDPSNTERQTRRLLEEDKVFALVGSHTTSDGGMVRLVCNKPIPDIGFQLDWNHARCKNAFSVPGQIQKNLIGEGASGSQYLNKANGVKNVAIFWLRDSEVSVVSAFAFEAAMLKNDPQAKVCYEQETSVFETGFDQFVLSMRDKCPAETTGVYTVMENASNIRLAKAMRAQGYKPKVYAPTFTSYLQSFIDEADGATEGAYIAMPQIPFERCQIGPGGKPRPPCRHPELQRYVQAVNRYHPNAPRPGSFGGPAWGQAALFVEAVKSCGANLTRACILRFLNTTGPFSANGFVSPNRPSNHHIYTADLIVQVRNGKFVELPKPAGHEGPPGGRDFWDTSEIFDWMKYYCRNKGRFPNTAQKDRYAEC